MTVSARTGAVISVVVVAAMMIGAYYIIRHNSGLIVAASDKGANDNNNQSVLVTDFGTVAGPTANKEVIAQFNDCRAEIRTDIDGYPMKVKCFNEDGIATERFSFNVPAKLDGKIALSTDSVVYQYGENDYEVGLKDAVGEKRYPVTLWEQPK